MLLLATGILLFWLAHGLKIHAPRKRAQVSHKMGEGAVKGLVALALLGSVTLIVVGYQEADYIAVWYPPSYLTHVNNLLMVAAVALFIAGGFKSKLADALRHPQLAGVKVWALAHLLVNGDLASILLFGSMLAWAVVAMIGINKRDGKPPLVPQSTRARTLAHGVVSLVMVFAVALAHNYLGVWPFAGSPPV
ncbi:MAG: NnrU family protein [Pseudomonadota bacterium]